MRFDSGLHPLSGVTFLLVALNLALPAAIGTLTAGALPKIDSDFAAMLGAAALAAVFGLFRLAGEALARARTPRQCQSERPVPSPQEHFEEHFAPGS